ncbi:hypothetical protein NLG97_g7577 [Lecanicillium saksenae]|uniref:Uncharacterized protein n=1 Tax=Lecanicillium saksenae TaxID=468837 RepID=A0ACC1QLG6_9HYPO|nr:hypothetical protein NLG97_g7577 [Lecanicillium saksenae]
MDKSGADISGTVRSATLPLHIQYSVHDIASTLKRLLSTLPGGILGSLLLFDSFIAIQSQLNAEPEFPRTNQTKVRARLIALAIGTIESQYRRELICAIFGLLSMIGRIAELAPREDEAGLPLPTTDLMGYGALSICFGPLLIGDLLPTYTMKIAAPDSGLVVLPPATQQIRKETRRSRSGSSARNVQPAVDKILIANRVTEMLISNWRDIVRQMKSLGTHRRRHTSGGSFSRPSLRPSASETFLTKVPKDYSRLRPNSAIVTRNETEDNENDAKQSVSKRSSGFLRQKASVNTLSPTIEESPKESRLRNDSVIKEEVETGNRVTNLDTSRWPKPDRSTMTEGTQTETYSPVKRKRFTVPPRLSSIDSLYQSQTEAEDRQKHKVSRQGERKANEDMARSNSGAETPPQFYSPAAVVSSPTPGVIQKRTSNENMQENQSSVPTTTIEHVAQSARYGARSPETDSKYQLKRYKRSTCEPLTGSPSKNINRRSPGKWRAHTNGLSSPASDTGYTKGGSKFTGGSNPNSPVKISPRKLRRSRSGPLTNTAPRKENDVFKSSQCAPVGVWRNGVQQKSPMAKMLRSSVSDGVSLRASAIRSLINAGKSRIRSSQVVDDKRKCPYIGDEEPNSWAKCSQEGLPFSDKPESIVRHLNSYHGYNIAPGSAKESEAVMALYQVILSLHDRLIQQEMEAKLLQKRVRNAQQDDETGRLRQDVGMWRRRAESAEKRVLVFERFTERLKDIRDAAIASEKLESPDSEQRGEILEGALKLDNDFVAAAARVRFAEVDGNEEPSSVLEGTAGGRASVENRRGKACTECDEEQKLDTREIGNRGEGGMRPRPASIDEVAELWMAAKELLDMDKNGDTG